MSTYTYSEGTYKLSKFTKFSHSDSLDFLKSVWSYTSLEAQCFCIVIVENSKLVFKHFCLSNYKNYGRLIKSVEKYINSIGDISGKHIYFQVLPLAVKPAKGRGSERDVKVGRWLWADLDYKSVVESEEFQGCRELEDYALECYYSEGDKWIHVKRPPLSEVLSKVKETLGLEPWFIVDSGAGYHIYFKLSYEVDSSKLKNLETWIVDKLQGDPQSKDLARILRLPGSINPRVGRLVQVVYSGSQEVDPEELLQRIGREKLEVSEEGKPKPTKTIGELRELNDSEILRIVELLKDSYKPGYRQLLLLYLSGWLAKARISPISAVKIVKHLYELTNDSDPLKTRLSTVIYSYRKSGVDVDKYASEIEALTNVKPYGLEKEIVEEAIKGRSGLQEVIESVLGEERAIAIIHELSEILQTLSPFRDSIVELVDYEKQLYAVANLRKLIIARAKRVNNTLVYKERVAVVCPTKVTVYSNPIGGITKYEITVEGATLQRPLTIGPATVDEIADRIIAEGLVYHRNLVYDAMSAIIQAFIRKGKAEVKSEVESPGFYLVDNKLVPVKYEVGKVDVEKLREALELLNELAEVWFKHAQEKFSTVIKWGAIAPFGYILKQKGKWIPWLYLYGDSATGKTTLGKIVLKMWGLDAKHEKTGASIDTTARLGYVLSMSTFPILVNEPGGALSKEDVVEMAKSAVENTTARGKYLRGTYTEYPALSCLIFTSNKFLPRDDALLRRLKVITFSYGEKIPLERQREFMERVEPRLGMLSEVGKCIAKHVIETQGVEHLDGKALIEKCYEVAGLDKSAWLNLEYTEASEIHETIIEEFVERFKKYVNDLYARYVSRIIQTDTEALQTKVITPDQATISEKLSTLLGKHLLPGARAIEDKVIITSVLLSELGLDGRISLKSLAEILNCEYKNVKLYGKV
ncbi:MAG: hypothetical protein QXT64_04075, partial [Desulfurococcaceae archaeon]